MGNLQRSILFFPMSLCVLFVFFPVRRPGRLTKVVDFSIIEIKGKATMENFPADSLLSFFFTVAIRSLTPSLSR